MQSAKISIVIPTLNAAEKLPACCDSILHGVAAGVVREVIVSDGGSSDGTVGLADSVGAQIVTGPAGRGGQLARGVAASRGDWILVLHADTILPEDWVGAVSTHIAQSGDAAAFRLRFDRGGAFVAGWANLRSRWLGLPYGDQGLLISRALYNAVGGYRDQPLMEDVAIARALKGRIRLLEATVTTSAARYEGGWIRRGARNLWTLARYFAGTSPEVLARSYRR